MGYEGNVVKEALYFFKNRNRGQVKCNVSRILAVVDAYDAMTHYRVYRKAMGSSKAVAEIKKSSIRRR